MHFSPSTARLFQESEGGEGISFMEIYVGNVHLMTIAQKPCYKAAFSLLTMLSKTAAFMPCWCISVQNAFFSIYS